MAAPCALLLWFQLRDPESWLRGRGVELAQERWDDLQEWWRRRQIESVIRETEEP
jgi:hypothetical protein